METILAKALTISRKGRQSMFRRNLQKDTGQALLELALVVPIFSLLLLGAVEYGRLAYAAIEVANAARAGAAYASQNHVTADASDPTNLANIQAAATQDAPDVGSIVATASNTCSCSDGTSGVTCANAGTTCISPGRILESVQVNTTATVNLGASFTLHGSANMRVIQ
jgi:Flp pilus assembly protein TadG